MQRLRAALRRRHRLDHGARDVVVGVLRGQRPSRRLAMRAQRQRALVLWRKVLLDERRPQQAAGPELGDLHEEIHAGVPEERQARREAVDVEAGSDAGARIFDAVGDGVGELQVDRRAGLLDVIAGDRDRVEFRHVPRRVADDVGDDPHRWFRRVDVGVADHELLQDVVLDGPAEVLFRDALFFARHDVERHDRQHRAVHGHRHRHLAERDAVEQLAHVEDGIDRHAGHADVAGNARMVAVVAAMGGEVEGDRQAFLAGGEVAPVKGVRCLGGREAGILADRPGLPDMHGRVGAADERRRTGQAVEIGQAGEVALVVEALDRDAFRRRPGLAVGSSPVHASALRQAMPAKSGIIGTGRSSGRCASARGARRKRPRLPRPAGGLRAARRRGARMPADRASCRRSGACRCGTPRRAWRGPRRSATGSCRQRGCRGCRPPIRSGGTRPTPLRTANWSAPRRCRNPQPDRRRSRYGSPLPG